MDASGLQAVLERGKDSRHQFRADFISVHSLASELAALANGAGERLFLDVTYDVHIASLRLQDVGRFSPLISKAAGQQVHSPLRSPLVEEEWI